jgi:predicted membrane protein
VSNRILLGSLLILIGAAIILNSYFNVFDSLWSWWPLLIIFIGLGLIVKRAGSAANGLIITALGMVFLAKNLKWIPGNLVFPVLLILAGLWFIFSRFSGKLNSEDIDKMNHITIFSGLKTNNLSQDFKGGSITAIFGGSDVDLRNAKLSDQGAYLELIAVFGGIELIVPKDWKIHISGVPIFGGWENKTQQIPDDDSGSRQSAEIYCIALFGGVTVKN